MCSLKLVAILGFLCVLSLTVDVAHGRAASQSQNSNNRIDDDEFDDLFKMQGGFPFTLTPQGGNIGGDFMSQLQNYKQLLDEFLVTFSEDMAEQSKLKCHALNVTLDYEALKNDMVGCMRQAVNKIMFRYMEIANDLMSPESTRVLQSLQSNRYNNADGGIKLNDDQKKFITNKILTPACQTVMPLAYECEKPEYKYIAQLKQCQSDVEKDVEDLAKVILSDICKNDGVWIFDLIEANPQQCVNEIAKYAQSSEHKTCEREWMSMIPDKKNLGRGAERFQLESNEQFCNISRVYRGCLSNLLINSCPQNPKFGEVLLNIFTESRSWLYAKCGSMNLSGSFWFVMLFAIIARFLKLES